MVCWVNGSKDVAKEVDPLKQRLKLSFLIVSSFWDMAKEVDPLKQGLKPGRGNKRAICFGG